MRVYVSLSYWVIVLAALVSIGIGVGLVMTGSGVLDRLGGLFVVVCGLLVAFLDVWRFLLVAGPDSVSFGRTSVWRSRRISWPYADLAHVARVPNSRGLGYVLRLKSGGAIEELSAVFLTAASADRWVALLEARKESR